MSTVNLVIEVLKNQLSSFGSLLDFKIEGDVPIVLIWQKNSAKVKKYDRIIQGCLVVGKSRKLLLLKPRKILTECLIKRLIFVLVLHCFSIFERLFW